MKSGFFRRLTAEILACGMILTSGGIMAPAAAYAGESETVLVGVGADGTAEPAASENTESAQTQAVSETAAPATEAQTAAPATEQPTEAASSATESTATEPSSSTSSETASEHSPNAATESATNGQSETPASVSTENASEKATETSSESDSESEKDSESETEKEYAQSLDTVKTADGKFVVEITDIADAKLPEGSRITVEELSGDAYQAHFDAAEAVFAPDEDTEIVYAKFLDIKIVDKDGNKISKLAAPVAVKISLTSPDQFKAEELHTVHFPSDGSTPEDVQYALNSSAASSGRMMIAMRAPAASSAEKAITLNNVVFKAEGFSVYGVIGTDTPVRRTYVFHNADGSNYQFKDKDGNATSQQILKTGESLQDPGIPVGEGEFLGWYTAQEGGDEVEIGTQIDFTSDEKSSTIDLYARFAAQITASYHDEDGNVFKVDKIKKNTEYTPHADYTSEYKDGDWTCIGWSQEANTEAEDRTAQSSIKVGETSIDLYPVIKQAHWIYYDDQGADSSIAPTYVLSNATVPATLPVPQKSGYTFQGWYQGDTAFTDQNGAVASTNQTTISQDIHLTAKWAGEQTTYKIIRWLQNPNDDNYMVAGGDDGVVTKTGTAGETTTVDGSDKTFEGFDLSTAKPVENQVIRGDGTTVVNVYYDRKICHIKFYNETAITNGGYSKVHDAADIVDGKTYYRKSGNNYTQILADAARKLLTPPNWDDYKDKSFGLIKYLAAYLEYINNSGNVYERLGGNDGEIQELEITARYGADIRDQWPSRKGYPSKWATSRGGSEFQSGVSTMPLGDENNTTSFWMSDSDGTYVINTNYYLEQLDGSYQLDHTDSFRSDSTRWSTTAVDYYAIDGFTINMDKSTAVGGGFSRTDNKYIYEANMYYTRNTYNITFTNGQNSKGLTADQTATYKFEESIAGAADNVTAIAQAAEQTTMVGYTFTGWYTDPYGEYKYEFTDQSKMPAGNLILYAHYEPVKYSVTFDPAGGTMTPNTKTIQVPNNTGIPAEDRPDVVKGNDTFMGWYLVTGTDADGNQQLADTPYNFETPVTQDITLVAKWYNASAPHYTITYDATADGKDAPDDNRRYAEGATILLGKAATPTGNKVFLGWKLKKADGTYGPVQNTGEEYKISAEDAVDKVITFVAEYGEVDTTYITWVGNGGKTAKGDDSVGPESTPLNANVSIKAANTFTREHYEFLGWAKKADAAEPWIKWNKESRSWTIEGEPVKDIIADAVDQEQNNKLYAVWKLKTWKLSIQKYLDDSPYAGNNYSFTIAYNDQDNNPQTVTVDITADDKPHDAGITVYDGSTVTVTENVNDSDFVVTRDACSSNTGKKVDTSLDAGSTAIKITSMTDDVTAKFTNKSKIVMTGITTNSGYVLALIVSVLALIVLGFGYAYLRYHRRREW